MKLYATSRISRRLGERLFLKPERDAGPKSAMVRRPYPPGMHRKPRTRRTASDFGTALREKQKTRFSYIITDQVLRNYVRQATQSAAVNAADQLLEYLELRLDNVLYRLGLAPSRLQARHLVSYGHIAVNGRPAKIPSRQLRPGDRISIRESAKRLEVFKTLAVRLKKYETPAWLALDREKWEGEVRRLPMRDDQILPIDLDVVIEYYSR